MTTTLDPVDYWRLRALTADLTAAQSAVEQVRQRRDALWAELAAKYALDPAKAYAARDADCALAESPASV